MTLHAYPDGHLGLHLNVSLKTSDHYHSGKRTLVHLPVDWNELRAPKTYDDHVFEPRELQAGDEIGMVTSPFPRIQVTEITKVEHIRLHDMPLSDLVLLGRTEDDLDAYRESWDRLWGKDSAPEGEGEWPWKSNPEVYSIYWKPLRAPAPDPNPCPPPNMETKEERSDV